MNKIATVVLLFVTHIMVAQKESKEKFINKFSENVCKCINQKGFDEKSLNTIVGLCLIESIGKYSNEVEKYYGKNIISNKEQMRALGENVGANLVFSCPVFADAISQKINEESSDEDDAEETVEETLFINGTIISTNYDQFLTFKLKEDSGKTHSFLLLEDFENLYLITDSVLKPTDNVKVSYYLAELYDAKIKSFVTYKVILDITKI
jgi:hypothetical protein